MINVVGLGLDPDSLPEDHAAVIEQATMLVGGKRQLDAFSDHPAERVILASPLRPALDAINAHLKGNNSVVVLADGDPLFFGIGNTLVREFGPDRVHILPNVTTVQAAAARLKIPLQDVRTVSLHGRGDLRPLFAALMSEQWVAVLTDQENVPSSMAQALLDKGAEHLALWVFEDLESEQERVERYTLREACDKTFSRLNVVLFERRGEPEQPLGLGMPDEGFAKEGNLITKWPVRAAGLAALRLKARHTVWDLGAGCGAVAIEASAVANQGLVVAVEKRAGRVAHIRENIARFGALLVETVHGTMPEALADLPDPDRVFVGGGLGRNPEILEAACTRLKPGGRVVVHCVLLATLESTRATLDRLGWQHAVTLIHPSQSLPVAGDERLVADNPVFIVAADKPEQA